MPRSLARKPEEVTDDVIQAPRNGSPISSAFLVRYHERAIIGILEDPDVLLTQIMGRCHGEAWKHVGENLYTYLGEIDYTASFGDGASPKFVRGMLVHKGPEQDWWPEV